MKKMMSLLLGLSLVVGAATFAFAQDTKSTTTKKTGKKTNKKKTTS